VERLGLKARRVEANLKARRGEGRIEAIRGEFEDEARAKSETRRDLKVSEAKRGKTSDDG
jgi:hypothetical protein